jgi:hypothetical protein
LEKDSENLLCLWDYGMNDEAPLGSPFIGEPRCGRLAKVGGRAASPCDQKLSNLSLRYGGWDRGEDCKRKRRERRGRWPAGHRYLAGWPHLASTQLPLSFSPHLAPLMLTPLTKSIKSKENFLHLFSKVLFISFWKGVNKNGGWKGEKMQMVEEGRKRKYEIATDLFSRWEHHILGLWASHSRLRWVSYRVS